MVWRCSLRSRWILTKSKWTSKGVVVSGDTGYGEAYCKAGDVIAEQYNVPCLYKVENDGSDEDIEAIKKMIA